MNWCEIRNHFYLLYNSHGKCIWLNDCLCANMILSPVDSEGMDLLCVEDDVHSQWWFRVRVLETRQKITFIVCSS